MQKNNWDVNLFSLIAISPCDRGATTKRSRPSSEPSEWRGAFQTYRLKGVGKKGKLWEAEVKDGASSEGQDVCRVCKKERIQLKKKKTDDPDSNRRSDNV